MQFLVACLHVVLLSLNIFLQNLHWNEGLLLKVGMTRCFRDYAQMGGPIFHRTKVPIYSKS
jgi:hypothetical protein